MSNVKYDLNPDILHIVIESTDDVFKITEYNMKPSLFATLPEEKKIAIEIVIENDEISVKPTVVYFYENNWIIYGSYSVIANMDDDVWELSE